MTAEKSKKPRSFRTVVKTVAVLTALAAVVCFITPSVRKSDAVSTTGTKALDSMRLAATAISYYSGDDIQALALEPAMNSEYKNIAGLMAQLCSQQGFEDMYLLVRTPEKKLQYLVDGSYRDNGKVGTDYNAPADNFPEDNGYKSVKSVVDKIYSGKTTGDHASELVTRINAKKAVVSCLPVYAGGHAIAAVLCIESDPGDTAYHMVGAVNIYYAGLICLAVTAVSILLLMAQKKIGIYRENKRIAKEMKEAEAKAAAEQAAQTEAQSEAGEPAFGESVDGAMEPPIDTPQSPYQSVDDAHLENDTDGMEPKL